MAMGFLLSDFCISKLSFFDSDFDANYSFVKRKGTLFLLFELNNENANNSSF